MARVVAALGVIAVVRAHVCFESGVVQRGPRDLSVPGSSSCYRREGYCGGVPVAAPVTEFVGEFPETFPNFWWPRSLPRAPALLHCTPTSGTGGVHWRAAEPQPLEFHLARLP